MGAGSVWVVGWDTVCVASRTMPGRGGVRRAQASGRHHARVGPRDAHDVQRRPALGLRQAPQEVRGRAVARGGWSARDSRAALFFSRASALLCFARSGRARSVLACVVGFGLFGDRARPCARSSFGAWRRRVSGSSPSPPGATWRGWSVVAACSRAAHATRLKTTTTSSIASRRLAPPGASGAAPPPPPLPPPGAPRGRYLILNSS